MNMGNRLNIAKRRIQAALKIQSSSPASDKFIGELLAAKLGIPILPGEIRDYILQCGEDAPLLASWGPALVMKKDREAGAPAPPKYRKLSRKQSKRAKLIAYKTGTEEPKRKWVPREVYLSFYKSPEWQAARYEAIKKHGRRCLVCGRTPHDHGIAIHVDHIKPRSLFPELELCIDNLQVLCEDCNLGKSNRDSIDWR